MSHSLQLTWLTRRNSYGHAVIDLFIKLYSQLDSQSDYHLVVNIGQAAAGFAEEALAAHNDYRAKHGAPPMSLDPVVCHYSKLKFNAAIKCPVVCILN